MKIVFLIATVHDIGGTAGAVITQANNLVDHHDVEILSVYRTSDAHHFPLDPRVVVRDLVDQRDDRVVVAGLDPTAAAALQGRPPLLVTANADPGLDALTDVALEAALPTLQADVLVTVTPALLAYATQLAPARVALVHQEHRSSSQRPNSRDVLLDHARRADVVAMLTEPMAAWMKRELGPTAPEVVVVPNALAPGYRPRSLLTEPVILAAGRLASEKQWPHLISAFGRITDRIPEWRLRIFGDGHGRFDAMGITKRLGLWDRVELPGPTSDLTSEWGRASISALTSQPGEGFPLVIQEAMAAGVPVVAYDMPSGPRDQIDDGVDGLLVTSGSEAGLAAGLLRLATDLDERRRLGAAARAKAATWDSASITARWLEIYDAAVRRRAASATGRATALHVHAPAAAVVSPDRAPAGRSGVGVTPERARHETLRRGRVVGVVALERLLRRPAGRRCRPGRRPSHRGAAPVPRLAPRAGRAAGVRLGPRPREPRLAEPARAARRRGPAPAARPHRPVAARAVAAGRGPRLHLRRAAGPRVRGGRGVLGARPRRRPALRPGGDVRRGGAPRHRDGDHPRPRRRGADPAADDRADAVRVRVPGRRRLHVGRRQRRGLERRPRGAAGRGLRRHDADPRRQRTRPVRRPRGAALLAARPPPLRAVGAPDPPRHRRAGARRGSMPTTR